MKTLITGAAGFVGRHFAEHLEQRNWDIDRCDITLGVNAHNVFKNEMTVYDLVVHAAAVAPHRTAIDGQPSTFIQNNHLDAAMFDWAIYTKQRHVLYLSSSAAYPIALQRELPLRGEVVPRLVEDEIDLDYPEEPDGRYGLTKLMGEHMARAARSCGVPVTVVRPFSGYGEDQGVEWPFGAFIDRIKKHETPFTVWGSAEQLRDWIHISDVVRGAMAVVEAGVESPVNLCTGQPTAVGDLALIMMQMAGYSDDERVLNVDESKPLGVMNRVGDPHRLWEFYEPKVSIEEGIARALKAHGVEPR